MTFLEDLIYTLAFFAFLAIGYELIGRVAEAGSWFNYFGG